MKDTKPTQWRVICRLASGMLDITSGECPRDAVTVYMHEGRGYFALESAMCQCAEYDEDLHELCPDYKPGARFEENADAINRLAAAIKGHFDGMERKEAAL